MDNEVLQQHNFTVYNKEEEMPGGQYWLFLDASDDEVDNVLFLSTSNVIRNISNNELKEKMIKRVISFINMHGMNRVGNDFFDLCDKESLKDILNKALLNLEQTDKISSPSNIVSYIKKILELINDDNYKRIFLEQFFNIILEKYHNEIAIILDVFEYDKETFKWLIDKYYDKIPIEYLNYIKIKYDSSYVDNYIKEFEEKKTTIGIDPNISIGVEIEANMPRNIPSLEGKLSNIKDYIVDGDATVPHGVEVKNYKPFHDNVHEVSTFCAVCKSLSDAGCYYENSNHRLNHNAAGQINLGLNYLDSARAILNFYEIFCNCEELLFYISNEAGQEMRQNITINSRFKPISEIIGIRNVDELITREEVINMFELDNRRGQTAMGGLQYKGNTLCLRGTNDSDYRFEIRIPNGGANYQTWMDNIRLYGKMMEIAKKVADIYKKDEPTVEDERLLELYIDLQNDELSLFEKLKILMDLLFDDNNIKAIYYHRFKETIKLLDNPDIREKYEIHYQNPTFGPVEFNEISDSRLFSYDPETGVYNENGVKKII